MLKGKLTILSSNMLCARHLFKPKPISPKFHSSFILPICRNVSSQKQETSVLDLHEQNENEELAREAEIERKRNKSGLRVQDYNRQHDKPPYDEPKHPHHESLVYRRRLYGKYGEASKVNPAILWPSKVELAEIKEYMSVAQPFTIQELINRLQKKKEMEKEERKKAEAEVLEKVRRIPTEIQEFKKRMEKRRLKAEELIEKKNKLIMETKKHFDYPIDVRDDKFQMKMAEIKEGERKKMKLEKKALKQEKKGRLENWKKQQEIAQKEENEEKQESME